MHAMNIELSDNDLRECESAMSYIEDMAAWFDEETEEGSKLDFALRILDQINRRGRLSPAQKAWCEERVRAVYGAT